MPRKLAFLLVFIFTVSISTYSFAANPTQDMSVELRSTQMQEKEKQLRQQVEQKAKATEIKEQLPEQPAAPESKEKTLIKQINVIGVTLLSEKEIKDIVLKYKGKELTLGEMQKVAGLITDTYRQKGYITSRAYLPPQKIENGILEIRVIEGLMGDLKVTGNHYFKSSLFVRKIDLKKGEPFDYNKLRANLSKINSYVDRSARAVLLPGKDTGSTDVNLEVKDRLPIHIGLDGDNFGSRFIEKYRYEGTIKDNNLLGFDDALTLQYQGAQAHAYSLTSLRYLIPVTDTTEIGYFMAQTKLHLGREFEDVDARGKSRLYSLYATQDLISKENVSLSVRLGFDYKDVYNFQREIETSRDRMRVVKTSFNLDVSDKFGRTILDNEINFGIPDFMGGLDAKDPSASRVGSGGKFVKDTVDLLRLQKMPFNSTLLWKNQVQISPYILTSTEQYQLGGIANLRGYAPAEAMGDNGYATTLEWSFPPYFVSKNVKVPFSKGRLYDALRFEFFYDWGNVQLHNPQAEEKKSTTLSDVGCGIRFNLPEDFYVRFDVAWPLGRISTDGNRVHPWIQVTKEF